MVKGRTQVFIYKVFQSPWLVSLFTLERSQTGFLTTHTHLSTDGRATDSVGAFPF